MKWDVKGEKDGNSITKVMPLLLILGEYRIFFCEFEL